MRRPWRRMRAHGAQSAKFGIGSRFALDLRGFRVAAPWDPVEGCPPAVRHDDLSCHVTGPIRRKEENSFSNISGLAKPAHWHVAYVGLDVHVAVLDRLPEHLCFNHAWSHCVDPDRVAGPFDGEHLDH